MNKKSVSVVVLIISLLLSFGLFWFRDSFREFAGFGLFGIFLINFASSATFFVSGPAFLTVIAGGSIYNPLAVAIVSSLGASLGDMVSFFFGYSGRTLVIKKLEKKIWFKVLEDVFKAFGTTFIFIISLVPNPFFDGVGLIAGVLGFKPQKFFLIMLVGRFIRFIILSLIGAKYY